MPYVTTAERIGMEKGREEGRKETARNLLLLGILTEEQIARATELPIEAVVADFRKAAGHDPHGPTVGLLFYDGMHFAQSLAPARAFAERLTAMRLNVTPDPTETTLDHYAGRGERVPVVDDILARRDIAVLLLGKLGYRTGRVESGEAAIESLKETGGPSGARHDHGPGHRRPGNLPPNP